MSDAARSDLAHLYRRAGFGATSAELDAAESAGYAATVASLVVPSSPADAGVTATPAPTFEALTDPGKTADAATRKAHNQVVRGQGQDLALWWLQRMVAATNPFPEKMTFFWHGHFATSAQKVRSSTLMLRQNELFRSQGLGAFDALDLAVAKDPAMMRWLDTAQDVAAHPNENSPGRTWSCSPSATATTPRPTYARRPAATPAGATTGVPTSSPRSLGCTTPAARPSSAQTGDFDGEDVVRILTHSAASQTWIPTRVWSRFGQTITDDPVTLPLAAAYGTGLDLTALFTQVFTTPQFLQVKGELVKQPVEYVVGALRALGVTPVAKHLAVLRALGQVPFEPPNVGGWPADDGWLSTAAAYTRLEFAQQTVRAADISAVADETPAARVDAVAKLLSLDGFGTVSRSALTQVSADPTAVVALALCSPEYVVN